VARLRLSDALQSHLFWAFDASTSTRGTPVFNPIFGFSRISSPEIGVEIESFKDGTFLYNRGVVKGGSVSPVLFERAASMFDIDFYSWIIHTLHGSKDFESGGTLGKVSPSSLLGAKGSASPRRDLLIVQFNSYNIAARTNDLDDPALAGLAAAGMAYISTLAAGIGGFGGVTAAANFVGQATGGGNVAVGIGPFSFATRIPARGWILHNCLPVRYKSGSDFDASTGEISLMELEVQPEYIEEFSLGAK
jgi:hypothetical protein